MRDAGDPTGAGTGWMQGHGMIRALIMEDASQLNRNGALARDCRGWTRCWEETGWELGDTKFRPISHIDKKNSVI